MHTSLWFLISVVLASFAKGSASSPQAVFSAHDFSSSDDKANHESPWTVFNHTIKRVAVIGAGPAGLQSAATLRQHGFTVRLFDRAPAPGGNWFYTDETPLRETYPDRQFEDLIPEVPDELPSTRFYEDGEEGLTLDERWREHWLPRPIWYNLHTNSPSVITELSDVKYPKDSPWVLSAHRIQTHVRAFASFHGLNSNDDTNVTAYATRVERLDKAPGSPTWTLTLRRLERLPETRRIKATWWSEEFDAVVVATGPYTMPHVPDIKGLVKWSQFTDANGEYSVYHSQKYRRPEGYAGKSVLIIGVGTSGSEIARDIEPYAARILASKREHDSYSSFQIRSLRRFPDRTEFIPEIASFEPISSFNDGIRDKTITLINGTVLSGIDQIILATGYRRANLFLQGVLNRTSPSFAGGRKDEGDQDPFDGGQLPDIHWTGHYIPDPTLAFASVRAWTMAQYQALGLAKVWGGTARLPNEKTMWEMYNDTSGRWHNFRGLFGTIPSEAIFRQFVAWLNNESLEFGGRFVDNWPIENREIFIYYANQEWLQGYISRENFTKFENLPADQWGRGYPSDALAIENHPW